MKEKRIILFGLMFVFLTSTVAVRASVYDGKSPELTEKSKSGEGNLTEAIGIATNSEAKPDEPLTATPSMPEKVPESDFEIEGAVLTKYNGKEEKVIVPDGVEIIGKGAFKGNPYVKEILLPDSVKCAESEAFAYMENLEMIEKGAFFYTTEDDVYEGSNQLSYHNVRDNGY